MPICFKIFWACSGIQPSESGPTFSKRFPGEAIYATRGGIWQPVDGVYGSTCTQTAIYVHILDCDTFQNITLPAKEMPKGMIIRKATLLNGIEVKFEQNIEGVKILIPDVVRQQNRLDTIVKLFIEHTVDD